MLVLRVVNSLIRIPLRGLCFILLFAFLLVAWWLVQIYIPSISDLHLSWKCRR